MSKTPLALFMEECGAARPLELVAEHPARTGPTRWFLPQSFALVGREPRADVFLGDEQVSRRHAYLQILDGRVAVLDLGSRTGTRWKNAPRQFGLLSPRHQLSIGPFRLCLLRATSDPPPPAARPGSPRVWFEFTQGRLRYPTWEMTRRIALIGRSRSCKVRLNDDSVSTVHCSLVRTPKGVWAVDLLGRGGIAVNGVPVRLARLEAGDQLRVGEFLLRCRYSQPLRSLPGKGLVAPSHPVAGLAVPSAGPSDLLTVPGGSAVVPSPAGDAVARALLLPLLNQLANVQMQMFDQFQQALAMVLQTLGAWHSDQVGLIGRELRQLREMTGELQSLRLQLAQQRPEGRDAAPSPGVQSIAGPSRTGGEGDLSTPGVCPAPVPQPADPGPRPAGEAVAAGPSPADAHDWLYQRVASLERERQSTWQRILGFLFKGEAGARPP